MKIRKDFIGHSSDGAYYLVGTSASGFNGILKGNKTAGCVIELLRNDMSRDGLVNAMAGRFDAPADVIARDVDMIIEKLKSAGALE